MRIKETVYRKIGQEIIVVSRFKAKLTFKTLSHLYSEAVVVDGAVGKPLFLLRADG